jgi:hypothetical protein
VVKRKSSLNYEIKTQQENSAVVHINRLKKATMPTAGKNRIVRKEHARPQFVDLRVRNVETPRTKKSTLMYPPQDLFQVTHPGLRTPNPDGRVQSGINARYWIPLRPAKHQ